MSQAYDPYRPAAPSAAAAAAAPAGPRIEQAEYDSALGPLIRKVVAYVPLTFFTLFFYRFWARTEIRRHLWAHIRIKGSRLEYSGRGIELFRGFVMLVGMMVAGNFVIFFAAHFLLPEDVATVLVVVANFAGFTVLKWLGRWWGWRYRLARTRWRSLRCGLEGSVWGYLGRSVAGFCASVFTAGLLAPMARIMPLEALLNGMVAGDRRMAARIEIGPLLPHWLVVWGSLPVLLVGGLIGSVLGGMIWAPLGVLALLAAGGTALCLYIRYRLRELAYIAHRVSWGPYRFQLDAPLWPVVGVHAGLLLLAALALAPALPLLWAVIESGDPSRLVAMPENWSRADMMLVVPLVVVGGLFLLLAVSLVSVMRRHWLLTILANRLAIWGEDDLERVRQRPAPAKSGGLGDAAAEYFDADLSGGF